MHILCQEYPKINTLDVCIIDDGISIPGSFEEVGIDFINDSEAIYDAVNCKSSDKEGEGLEGRGLNTSVNITSLGYGEEILIASRNGICIINNKSAMLYENPSSNLIGTFISLRVNNNILKNNYSIYEKTKIKKVGE